MGSTYSWRSTRTDNGHGYRMSRCLSRMLLRISWPPAAELKGKARMYSIFEVVVASGISLLRDLPRNRGQRSNAQALLQRFRETYPGVRADLLIDEPPGSPKV